MTASSTRVIRKSFTLLIVLQLKKKQRWTQTPATIRSCDTRYVLCFVSKQFVNDWMAQSPAVCPEGKHNSQLSATSHPPITLILFNYKTNNLMAIGVVRRCAVHHPNTHTRKTITSAVCECTVNNVLRCVRTDLDWMTQLHCARHSCSMLNALLIRLTQRTNNHLSFLIRLSFPTFGWKLNSTLPSTLVRTLNGLCLFLRYNK